MYGLRKIHKNGYHSGFQWPLEVGAIVTCPDWNSEPKCGGGLHLLPEAIGNYFLLKGHYWCVVEFDETKMVNIDNHTSKVPECKIVYLSESPDTLAQYFDLDKFDSRTAFYWAYFIGNKDIMIDKITDSEYAYLWTLYIGDDNVMIDRITESREAYYWAKSIGNRDIMINKITDPVDAYYWANTIGNQDIMLQRFPELKEKL